MSRALLEDIADAILDGTPVDWNAVDATSAPEDQALVEQLKTLAAWRRVARACDSIGLQGALTWGHLKVFERIGHGAFGDVHRAWDPQLDREVALKLLPTHGASRPDSDVIHEGQLLARVRHPHVVTIYGAERIDGRIGLWMELIRGRTLEEAIQEGGTFTASDVVRLGVELCGAVSAVHAAGLLHRDIKAQNIMLDERGRLVLMDLGAGGEVGDSTQMHTAGTPLYLAPEVLSDAAATPRSDVYSIGVVLFRLATGSYPVFGADLSDLRRAHAAGGGRPVRFDRPDIPVRLRRVLARAIDPNPDRRYADAEVLGAALAALERAPAMRRLAYAAAGVVALVAALGVGWSLGLRERLMPAPATLGLAAGTPTIAVLPFRNASSDPGNDDFIDGLTSELIRNLAAIDGLTVRSQSSSFFFKDRPRDLREIAKQLQVELVLEANVQRVGNQLRINAQLVQVPEDVPVWTQRFDRTLDDVFAIQDEISLAIVDELRLTLGRGQRRHQTDFAAYDLYLRGRVLVERRGTENAKEAVRLFEQVIAIDPEFAPAHAGLADAYAAMSWQISGLSYDEGLAAMRPAAMRALDLDSQLAEAHAAMGITYARELNWDDAQKSFERAIALNPTLTLTQVPMNYVSSTLRPLGRSGEAVELLEAALKMDPLSLSVRRELAMAQYIAGRFDDAIANLRPVLAVDPDFAFAANELAGALTFSGRPEEAIALFESRPEYRGWERWLMPAYVLMGRQTDIDRLVEAHTDERPWRKALIYAGLRDKDRTFEELNRAAGEHPHRVASVLAYPVMSFLRGDRRLDELRTRLNLR